MLPVVPRRADHPGRKRLDDRNVLSGILFVLYTGIPWEFLPQELGSSQAAPAGQDAAGLELRWALAGGGHASGCAALPLPNRAYDEAQVGREGSSGAALCPRSAYS